MLNSIEIGAIICQCRDNRTKNIWQYVCYVWRQNKITGQVCHVLQCGSRQEEVMRLPVLQRITSLIDTPPLRAFILHAFRREKNPAERSWSGKKKTLWGALTHQPRIKTTAGNFGIDESSCILKAEEREGPRPAGGRLHSEYGSAAEEAVWRGASCPTSVSESNRNKGWFSWIFNVLNQLCCCREQSCIYIYIYIEGVWTVSQQPEAPRPQVEAANYISSWCCNWI